MGFFFQNCFIIIIISIAICHIFISKEAPIYIYFFKIMLTTHPLP